MTEITRILSEIEHGDPSAAEQLLPLVYEELRKLAAAKMAQEKAGQTLQATALVHEAYLRLVNIDEAQQWDSRHHFFAAAAEAMRRILVENARRKGRKKYGGDFGQVELRGSDVAVTVSPDELLDIDVALAELAAKAPDKAELVKLRFFGGLTLEEAAESLQISRTTAQRYWSYARAWLYRKIRSSEPKT